VYNARMRLLVLPLVALMSCAAPGVEAYRYSLDWPPRDGFLASSGSRSLIKVDALWLPGDLIRCVVIPSTESLGARTAIVQRGAAPDLRSAVRVSLPRVLRDRIVAIANGAEQGGVADALVAGGFMRSDPDLEDAQCHE
jgi:hypothetical protein